MYHPLNKIGSFLLRILQEKNLTGTGPDRAGQN
jgi:hypothetical protein